MVSGGGVALLRAAKGVDSLKLEGDEKVGAIIVRRAHEEPIRHIVEQAAEGSVVVEKVNADSAPSRSYNAANTDIQGREVTNPAALSRWISTAPWRRGLDPAREEGKCPYGDMTIRHLAL